VSNSAYVISYICFPPPPSAVVANAIEHQPSTFKLSGQCPSSESIDGVKEHGSRANACLEISQVSSKK
jgi:hypothetical protein